jgi:DNA-binding transcriptional regulator YiaG
MLTIKQIRVGADLTLKNASELYGCSIPTFQKWEEEPRKMELGAFSNLVDYYNKKNPTRQILYTDVEF